VSDILNGIVTIKDKEFNFLKEIVHKHTGIFLAPHKKIMLQSRLNVRLRVNKIATFEEYVKLLSTDKSFFSKEILEIINRVTTNKTDFFRENHHFDFLANKYLPNLELASKTTYKKKLRIWCSASSTGEEPYSLAIILSEFFAGRPGWDVKIIASDIDTNVLNTASKGIYKEDRLVTVKPQIKQKYFTEKKSADGEKEFEAKKILKDLITYRKINLLEYPFPFQEKFDVIFCRNVIIYFDKPTQVKLFEEMSKVLADEGILIIGHSETLFGISDGFKFLGQTIYQKK
jgi:chemotaxis protein methyltransferase CheR